MLGDGVREEGLPQSQSWSWEVRAGQQSLLLLLGGVTSKSRRRWFSGFIRLLSGRQKPLHSLRAMALTQSCLIKCQSSLSSLGPGDGLGEPREAISQQAAPIRQGKLVWGLGASGTSLPAFLPQGLSLAPASQHSPALT